MDATQDPVVLVVEDEPDVAETYELWLAGEYEVRRADSGREAMETIDDSVDVVLLDRMMPGMAGDEVLERIREGGYDCRVAMVTAVDPDFDIVEMGFDDYVTKPPTREELVGTVEELLERGEYAERVREYRSLVAKRAALRTEKSERELDDSEAFADLQADIEAAREDLDEDRERLTDDAEFVSALRDLAGSREDGDDADGAGGTTGDDADGTGGTTGDDGDEGTPGETSGSDGDGTASEGPSGDDGQDGDGGDRP